MTLLFLPALYALWFRRSLDSPGSAPAQSEPLPAAEAPAVLPVPPRLAAE